LSGNAIRYVGPHAIHVPGCAAEQGKSGRGRTIGIVCGQKPTRAFKHKRSLKLDCEKLGVAQHGRVFKTHIGTCRPSAETVSRVVPETPTLFRRDARLQLGIALRPGSIARSSSRTFS
jgi:hypothetical protein